MGMVENAPPRGAAIADLYQSGLLGAPLRDGQDQAAVLTAGAGVAILNSVAEIAPGHKREDRSVVIAFTGAHPIGECCWLGADRSCLREIWRPGYKRYQLCRSMRAALDCGS